MAREDIDSALDLSQESIPILKASLEALRESEEKYRTLFTESRVAIYISAPEGRFVDVNQAALDYLGYSREEMLSLASRDLYVDPALSRVFQQRIEQDGAVSGLEARLRKKDGTEFDCLLMATVRRADDGAILGYQGIIHDITERKQLEAQLLQAQKMESIGRVAGGIAHGFNNLLGGIQGFASLIKSRVDPESQEYEFAQIIEDSSQRAAHLTRQLLTTSRKTPLRTAPMDVNEAVRETIEALKTHSLPNEVVITSDLQPDLPLIEGDMNQVLQVLMNLGINAADAMPAGGTLSFSTRSLSLSEDFCRQHLSLQPGLHAEITVADTGVGISEEDKPKIFEPFFTTKDIGKGTGLGLSVAYGVVNSHGGIIEVNSELGQGAAFTIYLPAGDTPHSHGQ